MKGYYFSFEHIHNLIKKAASEIVGDQFSPDYILAIGAGGFVPARILRTFINVPILAVTVASYDDKEKAHTGSLKKIQWLDGIDLRNKKILIVDDIDDTRATIEFCVNEIFKSHPEEVRFFVLHNKERKKIGQYSPQLKKIYIGENVKDEWITYPWESEDIQQFDSLCAHKNN